MAAITRAFPRRVQDTGAGDWLPLGQGIVAFENLAGALAGLEKINANYGQHRRAARELAENYFGTDKVLPVLLDDAMK